MPQGWSPRSRQAPVTGRWLRRAGTPWAAFACLVALVGSAASAPVRAAELDLTLEVEGRALTARGAFDTAAALTLAASGAPRPGERLVLEAVVRADAREDARSRADLPQAYYEARSGGFTARLGARRVFWGVTESRHLVDVVNQLDLADDLDGETRLGQPLVELGYASGGWNATAYALTGFRPRRLPGDGGPVQYPFPLAEDETRINARGGRLHLDFAARLARRGTLLGRPFDVAVSGFDGIDREPRLLPCLRRGSGFPGTADRANCDLVAAAAALLPQANALLDVLQALGLAPSDEAVRAALLEQARRSLVLVPSYDRRRQLGLELQWLPRESLALKLEALRRTRGGEASVAAVGGVELDLGTLSLGAGGAEATVILEGLYDGDPSALEGSRTDREVFLGGRLGFNDVAGTAVQGGALVDVRGDGQTYVLDASRRLGDAVRLTASARVFTGGSSGLVGDVLRGADEVRVGVERFF